ncbi:MAG: copper resistance protein B [Pseudomonadota bacterium]
MTARSILNVLTVTLCVLAPAVHAQEKPFPLPPKEWPSPVSDQSIRTFLLADRLEYRRQGGLNTWNWDAQGWIGGDYNKLWIKSEGNGERGRVDDGDVQLLYARRIAPFWHVQAGVRNEPRPSPSRNSAVLGIQGIAPYWFDIEAMMFLNTKNDMSGRVEAETDLLFTQRLILQSHFETNFSAAEDAARRIGHGINDLTFGLRLRYEIRREFAPYIGVNWTRKVGDTADFARRAGENVGGFSVVAGVRLWY